MRAVTRVGLALVLLLILYRLVVPLVLLNLTGGPGLGLATSAFSASVHSGDHSLSASTRFSWQIYGSAAESEAHLHNRRTGKSTLLLRGSTTTASAIALAPDGRACAVGDLNGQVRFFDLRSDNRCTGTSSVSSQMIRALDYSPDQRWLAVGTAPGPTGVDVVVWDIAASKIQCQCRIRSALQLVDQVKFLSSGDELIVSGAGGVGIWSARDGRVRRERVPDRGRPHAPPDDRCA